MGSLLASGEVLGRLFMMQPVSEMLAATLREGGLRPTAMTAPAFGFLPVPDIVSLGCQRSGGGAPGRDVCLRVAIGRFDPIGVLGLVDDELDSDVVPRLQVGVPAEVG